MGAPVVLLMFTVGFAAVVEFNPVTGDQLYTNNDLLYNYINYKLPNIINTDEIDFNNLIDDFNNIHNNINILFINLTWLMPTWIMPLPKFGE